MPKLWRRSYALTACHPARENSSPRPPKASNGTAFSDFMIFPRAQLSAPSAPIIWPKQAV